MQERGTQLPTKSGGDGDSLGNKESTDSTSIIAIGKPFSKVGFSTEIAVEDTSSSVNSSSSDECNTSGEESRDG